MSGGAKAPGKLHRLGTLVAVSRPDGEVIAESDEATALRGRPDGRPCWARMREVEGIEGLACEQGCTGRLMRGGCELRRTLSWRGEPWELSCIPVNGRVVSVLAPGRRQVEEADAVLLTQRESDVLHLLAEGMKTANIAESLGIGSGTVRSHVEHLRQKLGARTRAAIVGRAFRMGVLR